MNHSFSLAKTLKTLTTLAVACGMSCSVLAAELWVEPGKKQRDSDYEMWATTPDGEAYFSFGVPRDFDGSLGHSMSIVFISKVDKEMTYDLEVAVSQPNAMFGGNPRPTGPINSVMATAKDVPSDGIVKDYVHELGISEDSRIPEDVRFALENLDVGDYLTIKFKADPKGDVKIMGLRFFYNNLGSCEEAGTC